MYKLSMVLAYMIDTLVAVLTKITSATQGALLETVLLPVQFE